MNTPAPKVLNGTLIAAIATIAACDIAFGLTFQLQPLVLDAQGVPAWLIGMIAAMGPLGILIAGPFLPQIIARFGTKFVAAAAIVTIFVSLFFFKLLPALWWWVPLRFALGLAIGTLFTVSETWVLTYSNEATRGRVMGIYTSVLSLTFGIGPTIIPFTGIDGWAPWLICMLFVGLGLLPLSLVSPAADKHDEKASSMLTVLARQPYIFLCAIAATFFDAILISFFSIYGMRSGLTMEAASTLLGVSIICGIAFYYPLGVLADKWSRDGVIRLCALTTIVLALLLPVVLHTIFVWPVMVLFAGTAFGVYVIALASMGTAFAGADVVAASAAVAATWGLGGIAGPPISGWIIDQFGAGSFPYILASLYVILLLSLSPNGMRILRPVQL